MLENIVNANIKKRDIILKYKNLDSEQLFNACFDEILDIVDKYIKINNNEIFNKFKNYIQIYYPK